MVKKLTDEEEENVNLKHDILISKTLLKLLTCLTLIVDEVNRLTAKCSRNVIGQEDDALEEESEWLMLTHATVKKVQKILKEVGSRT